MGSDVAILFEARNLALLKQHISGKHQAALAADTRVAAKAGEVEGLAYTGVCSPERTVCSYLAEKGKVVMVTNSLAQLARLARTASGGEPNLASLPEYVFFRDRYKLEDTKESALLVLPDAAIRRWCSPQWRIAASRRTRAAALLSELHAANLDLILAGTSDEARPLRIDEKLPAMEKVELTPAGVYSPRYGTLGFMTPIIELPLTRVTEGEAEAYRRFRERYQRNWREYFDPIAVRFYLSEHELALDVTVMPLIAGSDYRELVELTRGSELPQSGGDPHEGILFRYGMSINRESRPVRQVTGFAVSMAPGLKLDALSWLGDYFVVYGDLDPFWDELARTEERRYGRFFEDNAHRLPVALYVDVSSALKVTAFLASVRAFIEQTAPGMTLWENKKYKGQNYVKVSPTGEAARDGVPEKLALYYGVTGKTLIITLSEGLLKRALKRQSTRRKSPRKRKKLDARGLEWLGSSVGMQADVHVLKLLELVARREYVPQMQNRAWGNIPVLNEWQRLRPDGDPVELHQQLWHTRLLCPGGGEYVWNEEWQTMESTLYGHPGVPKEGPGLLRPPLSTLNAGNFGLTFENDGVRARVELVRNKKKISALTVRIARSICRVRPNGMCRAVPYAVHLLRGIWDLVDEHILLY